MSEDNKYAAALRDLKRVKDDGYSGQFSKCCIQDNEDTILRALRLAEKLEQEPSEAMLAELMNQWDSTGSRTMVENFKAMVAQAKKEIEDAK